MKTIYCENIRDGKRCNRPRKVKKQSYRAKYCAECVGDIQRKQAREYYQKHRGRIRKLANAASKKRPSKPNLWHSSKKPTLCICPTCGKKYRLSLFLYDHPEGKPFPKRCVPCKIELQAISCPVAEGHGVGY